MGKTKLKDGRKSGPKVGRPKKKASSGLEKIGNEHLLDPNPVPTGCQVYVCLEKGCNFFSTQCLLVRNHTKHTRIQKKDTPSSSQEIHSKKNPPTVKTLLELNPTLKTFSPHLIEKILADNLDPDCSETWDDVAGMSQQRTLISLKVMRPLIRPDLYETRGGGETGLLLFGPPGTGKTMVAKLIAAEANCTYFKISSSSISSSYIAESEHLVRCLFEIAGSLAPSIIFVDEVDSILGKREKDKQMKHSLDVENEFFSHFGQKKGVLIVGATNRPHEIDTAAIRRFRTRIYVPLLDQEGRQDLIQKHLIHFKNSLTDEDIIYLGENTQGYSGDDIKGLCTNAVNFPIDDLTEEVFRRIKPWEIRAVDMNDFIRSKAKVKATVQRMDLEKVEKFNMELGTLSELTSVPIPVVVEEIIPMGENNLSTQEEEYVSHAQSPPKTKKAYRRGLNLQFKEHLIRTESGWLCKFCNKSFSRTGGYGHVDRRVRLGNCFDNRNWVLQMSNSLSNS